MNYQAWSMMVVVHAFKHIKLREVKVAVSFRLQ